MRPILAIARRELWAYFASPLGWVCLVAFQFITGLFFALMVSQYASASTDALFNPYAPTMNVDEWLVAPFFANTGVILLLLCPAISMRLFAEDRKDRSLELLLASPISTAQIVLGKYLGAVAFLAVLLASTLHTMVIVGELATPDPGVMACSYLGTLLMSASFLALGLLASAFTENQIVALFVTFVSLLGLWVLGWAESAAGPTIGPILREASMLQHLEGLTKGIVELRDLVYYASFIAFFLLAAVQRLEAERWR